MRQTLVWWLEWALRVGDSVSCNYQIIQQPVMWAERDHFLNLSKIVSICDVFLCIPESSLVLSQLQGDNTVVQRSAAFVWRGSVGDQTLNLEITGVINAQTCYDICQIFTDGNCLIFRYRFHYIINHHPSIRDIEVTGSTLGPYFKD